LWSPSTFGREADFSALLFSERDTAILLSPVLPAIRQQSGIVFAVGRKDVQHLTGLKRTRLMHGVSWHNHAVPGT